MTGPYQQPHQWNQPPPNTPGYGHQQQQPYPYAQYPVQQPYYGPQLYPARPTSANGLSIAGLILAILSLVVPFALGPTLPLIVSVAALIMSSVGHGQAKRAGGPTGMAIWGIALSSCTLFLSLLLVVLVSSGAIDRGLI